MGWRKSNEITREAFVTEILLARHPGWKLVTHEIRANHLWTVRRRDADGQRMICLDVLNTIDGQLAHNSMNEMAHLHYYDCPSALIDAAGAPINSVAKLWREAVRQKGRSEEWLGRTANDILVRKGRYYALWVAHLWHRSWNAVMAPSAKALNTDY
ncbi:hypothetical protein LSG25_00595 [Paralcaligenes sp. KSB-10]|uniref:hypothetical protein n=1 Tax=Paralcaligenes sp. KSB-10 TaxID=2901142 RepID=UPI001E4B1EDA|nr:hypothetical protein [Paralcaligenes sp. KSB-10]UHL64451.1 hypothetical protein LSG25_00595 [Paralcaligenes sp. KSB-10]